MRWKEISVFEVKALGLIEFSQSSCIFQRLFMTFVATSSDFGPTTKAGRELPETVLINCTIIITIKHYLNLIYSDIAIPFFQTLSREALVASLSQTNKS